MADSDKGKHGSRRPPGVGLPTDVGRCHGNINTGTRTMDRRSRKNFVPFGGVTMTLRERRDTYDARFAAQRPPGPICPLPYDELYAQCFEQTFGYSLSDRNAIKAARVVARLGMHCLRKGYDLQVYVLANMEFLQPKLEMAAQYNPEIRFQPNMLLGPNAENRYLSILHDAPDDWRDIDDNPEANARYVRARKFIFAVEYDVGRRYVTRRGMGKKRSVRSAAAFVDRLKEWEGLHGSDRLPKVLRGLHAWQLHGLNVRCRLVAACKIVDAVSPGLSRRLKLRRDDFDWKQLADLIEEQSAS